MNPGLRAVLVAMAAAAVLSSCWGGGDAGDGGDAGGATSGSIVYAATGRSGGGKLYAFLVDSMTGALTDVSQSDLGSEHKMSIALHPSGKYAYILEDHTYIKPQPETVMSYKIAATGALVPPGSVVESGGSRGTVTVDPTGTHLYVSGLSSPGGYGQINCYAVDAATGATTGVWGATGIQPTDTPLVFDAIDPTGKLAYSVGFRNVYAYSIDIANGALAYLGESPLGRTVTDHRLAFDPLGRFLYLTYFDFGEIAAFAIDLSTGALTPVGTYPAGVGPTFVALHPNGEFAYVVDPTASSIYGYRVNRTTGALTSIGPPVPTAGAGSAMIVVDPAGKFAYVSGTFGLTAYRLDAATGALSSIATVPTGGAAGQIAVMKLP